MTRPGVWQNIELPRQAFWRDTVAADSFSSRRRLMHGGQSLERSS